MDSLTQIVLGACVGAAVAPPARRRRGAVYGMVLGTLPDLDVFLPMADPAAAMVMHRSFSHSLLVLAAAAWPLWWLCARHDQVLREESPQRWWWAFALTLLTHPLLDACTTYGTQLLWPLLRTPFAWDNVFVIDPLYTLPLLLATLVVLLARDSARQWRWAVSALLLSTLYLGWGAIARELALGRARAALAQVGLPADAALQVAPGPLNTLLWRVLARDPRARDGAWFEAWTSLPGDTGISSWIRHAGLPAPDRPALLSLERLAAFSRGWYALREIDGQLVYADLRMGAHPWFVFRFVLAERAADGGWQPLDPPRQLPLARPPLEQLRWIAARIAGPVPAYAESTDATPWP